MCQQQRIDKCNQYTGIVLINKVSFGADTLNCYLSNALKYHWHAPDGAIPMFLGYYVPKFPCSHAPIL